MESFGSLSSLKKTPNYLLMTFSERKLAAIKYDGNRMSCCGSASGMLRNLNSE